MVLNTTGQLHLNTVAISHSQSVLLSDYSNTVFFYDENGQLTTLSSPKLLIVRYRVQEYYYTPTNGYSSTSYLYYTVPAGVNSYTLPNTINESDEDAGVMRHYIEQSYSVVI